MKRPTLAPAVTAPRLPRVLAQDDSSSVKYDLLVFCRQPNFRKYGSATHLKAGLRIVEVVEDVPRQPQLSGVSLQVPAMHLRFVSDDDLGQLRQFVKILGSSTESPCDTGALDVQCCLRQDCRSYRDL
jgi:hypothetical protein